MRLATSRVRTIGSDGGIFLGVGVGALQQQGLPDYVVGLSRKPVFVEFKKRLEILGQFSRPLIVLEDRKIYDVGMRPPQTGPSLAAGAAGTTTGTCVGTVWWRHKIGNKIILDSDQSPESAAVALVNQGRAWTSIPTDAPPRATHVVGGYSFEGDDIREAWERPVGVTTVDEIVGVLARGNVGPDIHELKVPPYTGFGFNWHARMWYAGLDLKHPYRAWYSEVNKSETIEGHIDTLDYTPITGIFGRDDVLVLFCRRKKFQVRGYTLNDFKIDKMPGFGCVSHHSIAVDYANRVWWAAEEGIVVNDEYVMSDMRTYWRRDIAANPTAFNNSWAIHDHKFSRYKLCTPRSTAARTAKDPATIYYSVSYFPDVAPAITFDIRAREDTAAGYDEDGNVITASCDGVVRLENVDADSDDDGDLYQKRFILRTGHLAFGRPGGNLKEAKSLVRLWDYITSELDGYRLYVIGGDEDCWRQLSTDLPISPYSLMDAVDDGWNVRHWLRIDVPASQQLAFTPADVGLDNWLFDMLPLCVHDHGTIDKVSGRGFVIQVDALHPRGLRYSGIGGLWEPGEAFRGAERERSV